MMTDAEKQTPGSVNEEKELPEDQDTQTSGTSDEEALDEAQEQAAEERKEGGYQ